MIASHKCAGIPDLYQVIPREGVESGLMIWGREPNSTTAVIPREGVERQLLYADLYFVIDDEVIPREGVERRVLRRERG